MRTMLAISFLLFSYRAPGQASQYNQQLLNQGFKKFKLYRLTEKLTTDFNGDKINDTAEFKRKGNEAVIVITDGRTHKKITIGNGNMYGEMQDNFHWASYWGIIQDTVTFEEIIKGDEIEAEKKIKLLYPSIIIRHKEGNGGIITYRKGKYDWVHQAD